MTIDFRRVAILALAQVFGMAGLWPTSVSAQTPTRPALEVRQLSTVYRNIWPADFTGDGASDLIAGEGSPADSSFRRVVLRRNNGNGTFNTFVPIGVTGMPAAVGDFNRDNRPDVIVVSTGGVMSILEGLGNGTFGPAQSIDPADDFRFGLAADMNADGNLDLIVGHGTAVEVRPGNGNLTFAPTMTLPVGSEAGSSAGAIGDFNRDGRPDLAVAQQFQTVFVYINRGGLLFTSSEIFIAAGDEGNPEGIHGIAAADLDRDGDADLVVPHTRGIFDYQFGGVQLRLSNGNGTFAAGVEYFAGVSGPWTAVTGDFNRDGIVDVAIGGRSWEWDDIADLMNYWDSVSIFPGRGNGTLAPAAPFRLDSRPDRPGFNNQYTNTHHALRAADLNRDGHLDLVSSPAAVLINRPLTDNRPPIVDAGPDLTAGSGPTFVSVRFTEPDSDWVRVVWRNALGNVVVNSPSFEWSTTEEEVLTVTVTDARGGVGTDTLVIRRNPSNPVFVRLLAPVGGEHFASGASIVLRWDAFNDLPVARFGVSVSNDNFLTPTTLSEEVPAGEREFVWNNAGPPGTNWRVRVAALGSNGSEHAFDVSDPFTIDPAAPGAFPWPWNETGDIQPADVAGSATFSNGTFTLRGGGADIWGTADQFRYVSTRVTGARFSGDFSITARVTSVENVNQWTKAGLMIRSDLTASSAHASVFVTPTTVKGVAFQRRPAAGGLTVHTPGPALTAPIWLKLTRIGGSVTAHYRKNITDAWTFIGRQDGAPGGTVHAMLVVSSHVPGRLAAARFDNVAIDDLENLFSWDIGTTVEGSTVSDGVVTTMEGDGHDIWGTHDGLRFHGTFVRGEVSITVRVRALENTHRWAKAGVMLREGIEPEARHVMVIVSPGSGVAMQFRDRFGGESAQVGVRAGTAPEWLRLTRSGDTFVGSASNDGLTWNTVGTLTLPLNTLMAAGIGVTSHSPGTLATAAFDDLIIR